LARKAPTSSYGGEALRRLHEGPLHPFYVLHGKERYFVRKAIAVLKQRILASPDSREMLYYPFYGSETSAEELINIADTVPFFQNTQLVLVWEAEKLKEPCRKALLEYAQDPSETTCLVLVAAENLLKASLFQYLHKQWPQACFGFPRLNRSQRLQWLQDRAKEKGLTRHLSRDLVEDLLSGGQVTLETLENQMEMLSLYFLNGEEDGLSGTLPFLLPEIPGDQGYLLTDALLGGRENKCMELLHRFLDSGTPSLLILSRIAWEIRRLWQIQEGMERGESPEELFRSLRVLPFKKDFYLSLARKIPRSGLQEVFFSLLNKDRELKSSRVNPAWHLEELCRDILSLEGVGKQRV